MRHGKHVGQAAALLCVLRFSDSGPCVIDQFGAGARQGQSAQQLDTARTDALKRTLGPRISLPNAAWVTAIVGTAVAAGAKVYRDVSATDTDRQRRGEAALRHCYQSDVFDVLDYTGLAHPCDVMPIFLPSESDAGGAARNDAAAIQETTALMVLSYQPAAEREAIAKDWLRANGYPVSQAHRWYRHFDPCTNYNTTTHHCDEYPFKSSSRGGPPPMLGSNEQVINPFGTRLQVVPKAENEAEGAAYGSFRNVCPSVANREPFLVVPVIAGPAGPPTDYFCTP